jgi:hypothetical protein
MFHNLRFSSRWFLLFLAMFFGLSCSFLAQSLSPEPGPQALQPTQPAPVDGQDESTSADQVNMDLIEVDYLYTSELITLLYPLYGDILDDFVIVTVTNSNPESVRIVVESEIVGYTSMAIDTVDIPPSEALEIRQNPQMIPGVIDSLNSQKPADVHIRVSLLDDGQKRQLLEQTHETLVFARRDFPWAIEGFTTEEVYDLLAVMVMPNDPGVEELLRAAADYTDSGIITGGYSGVPNDEDGKVWDRLQAIWMAESEVYDITYVDTPVNFTPGYEQRIRLPAEVLEQRSGNCIELAILYASAAEAMRLEAALVLVPGHAFVAIRTDQEGAAYYAIETTLVGRSTFEDAVAVGSDAFEDAMVHLDAEGENISYGWVTIWTAREQGINPLPWH